VESEFLTRLMERINANKDYPRYSRVRRETGEVKVGFTILKDGSIQDIRIVEASPFPALNEAALNAIRKVAKTDPIPEELHRTRWENVVPMRFEIKSP
jgi:protein TonB